MRRLAVSLANSSGLDRTLEDMMNLTQPETHFEVNISFYFHSPEFLAYNFIMILTVLLLSAILDTLIILALLCDRKTAFQIRTVLVNLLLGNLFVVLTLTVQHLTTIILMTTEARPPPLWYCDIILWFLGSGGGTRLLFTATFAIIVFVMIKHSSTTTKKPLIIVVSVLIWFFAFLFSAPLMVPQVVDSRYYGDVACYLYSSERVQKKLLGGYVGTWVVVLGVLPFIVTLVVPIVALCYIRTHQISGDLPFKKAMAKFALFLLLGNTLNFLGQAVPPIVAYTTKQGPKEYYAKTLTTFILMSFSLLPTPIIIIAYIKSVRASLRRILCCQPGEKSTSEFSRSTKRSSFNKSIRMGTNEKAAV